MRIDASLCTDEESFAYVLGINSLAYDLNVGHEGNHSKEDLHEATILAARSCEISRHSSSEKVRWHLFHFLSSHRCANCTF